MQYRIFSIKDGCVTKLYTSKLNEASSLIHGQLDEDKVYLVCANGVPFVYDNMIAIIMFLQSMGVASYTNQNKEQQLDVYIMQFDYFEDAYKEALRLVSEKRVTYKETIKPTVSWSERF